MSEDYNRKLEFLEKIWHEASFADPEDIKKFMADRYPYLKRSESSDRWGCIYCSMRGDRFSAIAHLCEGVLEYRRETGEMV